MYILTGFIIGFVLTIFYIENKRRQRYEESSRTFDRLERESLERIKNYLEKNKLKL